MKLRRCRSATPLSIAVLLFTSLFSLNLSISIARAQTEVPLQKLSLAIRTGSDEEKHQAISQLTTITSAQASALLLETLKNNLATKRGHYVKYDAISNNVGLLWTYVPSENQLLVEALGQRKYVKALPTFRKMLKVNEKWLGFSKRLVAEEIYLISTQPVQYYEDGDKKIYPEPQPATGPAGIASSLRLPAQGEVAWAENSLNSRVRELVRILGNSGGPQGYRDPAYQTLKEDVGLPTLIGLVQSGDPLVRPYAAEALGILGENLDETIPLLVSVVRDQDPRVRFRSVRAFGHLLDVATKTEDVTAIISALTKALSDPESDVRLFASSPLGMYALSHRSSADGLIKGVVPKLTATLDDRSVDVRAGAAHALGRIGPLTEQVVPALMRLLGSQEASDREASLYALTSIRQTSSFQQSSERQRMEKEIGKVLLKVAADPSRDVRYQLAEALGEIAPTGRDVVGVLIKLTRDPARGVRTAAARSLGQFKIERHRIVAALARMLNVEDEDAEVIEYTLDTLGNIGPEARAAAPAVRTLLKSANPRLREYAGYALEKIEGSSR